MKKEGRRWRKAQGKWREGRSVRRKKVNAEGKKKEVEVAVDGK